MLPTDRRSLTSGGRCRDFSVIFRRRGTGTGVTFCGAPRGGRRRMATAGEVQVALKRSPIYRFDDREVDTRLRQIQAGGQLLEAQPKAFDLLVYLIENRDRVVDKDELLEQLWAGTVVSDSALTQIVRKARSLAGDDGVRQAVIRQVQRRG